jgi:hypothetical protein
MMIQDNQEHQPVNNKEWNMKDYKVSGTFALEDKLMSMRGKPLVLSAPYAWVTPVLTVEFHTKWYEIFLIDKEGGRLVVYSVNFGYLDDVCPPGMSPYVDHVPNPICVKLLARRKGFELDELAENLITGRWQDEVVDFLVMECARCEGTGEIVITQAADLEHYARNDSTCRSCKGTGELRPEPK